MWAKCDEMTKTARGTQSFGWCNVSNANCIPEIISCNLALTGCGRCPLPTHFVKFKGLEVATIYIQSPLN